MHIIPKLSERQIRRFLKNISTGAENECWPYTGYRTGGYGGIRVTYIKRDRGILLLAHRLAWMIKNQQDPGEKYVLHRCDNRSCCNPNHLFLGTHLDNMKDRNAKGRGNEKLVPEQVFRIRKMIADGCPQKDIAKTFKVCDATISYIKHGRTFRWVKQA